MNTAILTVFGDDFPGMGVAEDEGIALTGDASDHYFMRRDFDGQTRLRMAAEVRTLRRLHCRKRSGNTKVLRNERRAEKGLEPRIEITGHLHSQNAKEYEVALDPVNAEPDNPSMDRPHFFRCRSTDAAIEGGRPARDHVFADAQCVFCSYFTITGLHGLHVPAASYSFTYGCR
jgi:hypothetical protein